MIGIIGAMDEEVNAFINLMDEVTKKQFNNQIFYEGLLHDKAVVVMKSGIGKSLSAMSATLLATHYDLKYVINIGSAGSLRKEIKMLDVVVAQRVAQSDFDLTAFGYKKGFDQSRYSFECDLQLVNTLENLKIANVKVGDITSSDTFVNSVSLANNILNDYPTALCADMEAASIGMVLDTLNIPFIIVRSISDNVVDSENNTMDFDTYLKSASVNSAKITSELIKAVNYK